MVGQSQQGNKSAQLILGILLLIFIIYLASSHRVEEKKIVSSVEQQAIYTGDLHPLEYSEEDVFYMAQAIYFEAILEPEECQFQVAHVIDTRRWTSPPPYNTIKGVVWKSKQFSYTHDGKSEKMLDLAARARAERIARLVLGGYSLDTTEGSLYYYNPDLADPDWKDDYQVVNKCGKHIFLKEKDKGDWS